MTKKGEELTIDESLNKLNNIRFEKHKTNEMEILKYVEAKQRGEPSASSNFNDYIKQTIYANQPDLLIITDLSNMMLEGISLKGADFTGSYLKGAFFYNCDLTEIILRDSDLREVSFAGSILKEADFRGADLSGCKFAKEYDNWIEGRIANPENAEKISGLKFSTAKPLMNSYIQENETIKSETQRLFDKQKQLEVQQKEQQINVLYGKLSYLQRGYIAAGRKSGNEEYDRLSEELPTIKDKYLKPETIKYIVDPSLANVVGFQKNFDPAYVRGEKNIQRQYVSLSRRDVETYLEQIKVSPGLTLNQFAQEKLKQSGEELRTNVSIVADCSPKRNILTSKWETVDLSGLDFSNARLTEVNFAGTNLTSCNFTGADISRTTFENAQLSATTFKDTLARDTNFFNSILAEAELSNSDFKRAYMVHSNTTGSSIDKVNFDYSNIKDGKWNGTQISDTTFVEANLEGISLAGADMRRVNMQHSILNGAILSGCNIIECDLNESLLNGVEAIKTKFEKTKLENIEARKIDLTESELDSFTSLEGADLQEAIMKKVQAENVNFIKVNLDGVNAELANLANATLEQSSMRFGNLRGAILDKVQASNIDLTGAKLPDASLVGADFNKAIMKDIDAQGANFSEAILKEADLRGAQLQSAILEKVQAQKALLQAVKTDERTNANEMDISEAIVNADTDKLEGAKGENIKDENNKGEVTPITIEAHNKRAGEIAKAQKVGWVSNKFSDFSRKIAGVAHTTAEFIKQPISTKTGAIIGVIAGALIGAACVAAIPFTGGLSAVALGGIIAGGVAAGAIAGGVGGGLLAKNGGLSTIAAAIGGFFSAGPAGAVVGLGVGIGVNVVAKAVTGKTADQNIAAGIELVANAANGIADKIGATEEGKKALIEKEKCQQNYQKAKKEEHKSVKRDPLGFLLENDRRKELDKDGKSPDVNINKNNDVVSKIPDKENKWKVGQHVERIEKERTKQRISSHRAI